MGRWSLGYKCNMSLLQWWMEQLCGSQMTSNMEGEYSTSFWIYIFLFSDQTVACSHQSSSHTRNTAQHFWITNNGKLTQTSLTQKEKFLSGSQIKGRTSEKTGIQD